MPRRISREPAENDDRHRREYDLPECALIKPRANTAATEERELSLRETAEAVAQIVCVAARRIELTARPACTGTGAFERVAPRGFAVRGRRASVASPKRRSGA
jgi:hypothetical protein